MKAHQLASRMESIEPESVPSDVARMCLLLSNAVEDIDRFTNDETLSDAIREVSLKLQLATDQHAAMTEELEALAASDPEKFTSDQIWVLVRAIKVQSQVLQLYLGGESLDV